MSKLRIALLTNYFPPDQNSGIGRYIEDLATGLAKNGHDIEVFAICNTSQDEHIRHGFKLHWILNNRKLIPQFLPFLTLISSSIKCRKKLMERHKISPFDIIEYPNTGITGLVSLLLKFPGHKPKFIIRLSSPRTVFKKSLKLPRITNFLESIQARLSDAIISVSDNNYKLCKESYGFSEEISHCTILHGLPLNPSFFENRIKQDTNQDLKVFYLGRMEDRKGFDVLARAWPIVVSQVNKAVLIVAGEDLPFEDGPSFYTWAIKDIPANALDKIQYLGEIDSETRDSLYQTCDLCVIPSRYESFGLISLEAMQYGKPVISTNVGGIPEVVSDGVTGILVPPDDHVALSNALIRLLQDEILRSQLGNNALREIRERFTIERVVSDTEIFYRSLRKSSIETLEH